MCKGGGLELDYVYSPNADRLLIHVHITQDLIPLLNISRPIINVTRLSRNYCSFECGEINASGNEQAACPLTFETLTQTA